LRVFVTGASGFVGGGVARGLVAAGADVLAMSRGHDADAAIALAGAEPVRSSLEHVVPADLGGAEAVVHCAAYVQPWGPPEAYWRANVEGTRHILDAARAAGVRRFVHIGAEAALFHGQPMCDVDESAPLALNSPYPYARSKAHAERMVLQADDHAFSTLALRPRLVWGPGDRTVLAAVRDMAERGAFAWVDGGRALTSTCHVENLAHGVALALERGAEGEAYFLTDGPPVRMRDFLTAYLAAAGVDLSRAPSIPGWAARGAALALETAWRALDLKGAPPVTRLAAAMASRECTVSDAKARARLGYRPVLSREEGLANLADREMLVR